MRNWILAAAIVLPLAVVAQTPGRGLSNFADIPKAEPFTETLFGIGIDDPYRWMERADRRADLEAWVNASSLHTTTELAALPGREPLFKALQAASRANDGIYAVRMAGGKVFYELLRSDSNVPVLMVREGGRDRLLLDPMAGGDGRSPRAVGAFSPSPDGSRVAVQLAEGGAEIGKVVFLDVATGKPLGEELSPVWGESTPVWLGNDTVLYGRMRDPQPGVDTMLGQRVLLHRLGSPAGGDVALLGDGVPSTGFVVPETSTPIVFAHGKSPWAVVISANARAEYPLAVARLADLEAGKPAYVKLADVDERVNNAEVMGDTLYYQTSKTDQNGEVRALDLGTGTPSLAHSRLVMRSGGKVITGIWATTDGLYVQTVLPSAANQLYFIPRGRGTPVPVALPASQAIEDIDASPDRTALTLTARGYTANSTYYRVAAGTAAPLGLASNTLAAARERKVVEEWATSRDRTRVPLTIVYSGARHGPAPTVIEAYGSYGVSGTPFYSTSWLVWNQRGGVYAYCHTRGGGELGDAWHRAGYQAAKVNAHDDLIACGRRLVQLGYATPKTLGIFGGSAAGLLVPMAALKAPDLFAAAVTRVGIVNATRLAAANNGPNQYGEMGDATTESGFRALAAQDAVLHLKNAKGGPDFLFTVGLNDKRVEPWMSAKLAAAMRARWGDRHLVLLRSDGKAGHGIGSTRDQALEERADIYAFFLNRFGAPGFTK